IRVRPTSTRSRTSSTLPFAPAGCRSPTPSGRSPRSSTRRDSAAAAESSRVADIPDTLVLKKHRDLVGRRHEIWWRRGLLTLLGAILIAGLANAFGQYPLGTSSSADAAKLHIQAPAHVRGGLMYEARFDIHARHELKQATLVLGRGWIDGLTI